MSDVISGPNMPQEPQARPAAPAIHSIESIKDDSQEEQLPDEKVDIAFASRYDRAVLPRFRMPEEPIPSNVVYQMIEDIRQLDGNPRLNLATYVTTWMDPKARQLIEETLSMNFIDQDAYGSTSDIAQRCLAMLADLYHAPEPSEPVGSSCLGSTEGAMLGGLALKKRWAKRRAEQGLPATKPNLVFGYNAQVCWHKFCRYFDVEEKLVPLKDNQFVMTPEGAKAMVDENTIGIVAIFGSTYNGEFEDVAGYQRISDELKEEKGWVVPIHVDAAAGGFIAPFIYRDLVWDFRLPSVASINVSGHKYGLVYPGVGWVLFRDRSCLPEEMIFHINYLGSDQENFTLNFSKPACFIVAQYYQLLLLGKRGYRQVLLNLSSITNKLRSSLEETGHFRILSKDVGTPMVAAALLPRKMEDGTEKPRVYDVYELSDRLKDRGWIVPAYTFAPDARDIHAMRIVVREDMSMTLMQELITDIQNAVEYLDELYSTFTAEQVAKVRHKFKGHRQPQNERRQPKHDIVC